MLPIFHNGEGAEIVRVADIDPNAQRGGLTQVRQISRKQQANCSKI